MIVRTWHGCVPLQHAEGFARHLEQTGVDHAGIAARHAFAGAFGAFDTHGVHFFTRSKVVTSRWPRVEAPSGSSFHFPTHH